MALPAPLQETITPREATLFHEHQRQIFTRIDRLFAGLLVFQWFVAIAAACWISPTTWIGTSSKIHLHVWAAVLFGGALISWPVALALLRPGEMLTRHVIAAGQMLMSALLIHLTGGRIETHFHIFGSLAVLAFYRDWRVLITASFVVACDHFLRGLYWPQSIFGVLTASPWRWLEHAGWVVFEDLFLIASCMQGTREMRDIARRQAELEATNEMVETAVKELVESEGRFRILSTAAPIGIFQADAVGHLLYTNPSLQETTGLTNEEALGDGWHRIVHPEDEATVVTKWVSSMGSGREFTNEFRVCTPQGEVRWVRSHWAPLYSDDGSLHGYVGTLLNITQKKQAEEALRRSEERFALAAQGANDGLWDWDVRTDEVFFSTRWKAMLGFAEHEIMNHKKEWEERLHPQDREKVIQTLQEHFAQKTPLYASEHRLRCKDGTYKWILARGQAVWNEAGEVTRIVGSHTDVTDRRRAELMLTSQYTVARLFAEATTLDEIAPQLLQAACESGEWDSGVFWTVDADIGALRCIALWHVPGFEIQEFEAQTRRLTLRPGEGLPGRAWLGRKPEWVTDRTRTPTPRAAIAARAGLHGAVAYPILAGEQVIGVLEFSSREERLPNADLLRLYHILGSQTGQFLQRQQMEAVLRTSEERFRTLSAAAPLGIFQNSPDGRCTYTNPQWQAISGLTEEQSKGNGWIDALYPEDKEAVLAAWQAGAQEGREFSREFRFKRPTGEVRWVQTHTKAILASNGLLIGHVGTTEDITERKQADVALAEAEERSRSLVESARDLVYIVSADGTITSFNPAFEAITGWLCTEWVGKPFVPLIHPEDLPFMMGVFQRLLQGERPPTFETRMLSKSGEYVVIEFVSAPQVKNGRVIGITGVGRDITERKRMEKELARAKEVAEAASQAKSEFLATMSHEIRTPMNGVLGMAGLLLDTELSPQQREFTAILKQSGDALLTIINDILDFSKIEAGKLDLEVLDFDLRVALEETIDLFTAKAQEKGLELAYLLHGGVPTAVRGDPGRLRQVLLNLLSNAVKFTEHGEVMVRAELVVATPTHATLRFTVNDTGVGIAPDRLSRLFQAFSQADASTTRKYGGTGLGLVVCKRLVELMGGEIGVKSTPGQGTTFWFTVQLEQQPVHVQEVLLRPREALQGRRVLVVDDNATNRAVLQHYLTAWGVKSEEAADGPQGLAALLAGVAEARPYDIAILDYQMPGMDGLELAQTIRDDQRLASLKLVLLTSIVLRGELEQARQAGIDAYLTKPVRPMQLSDCLALMLGQAAVRELQAPAPLVTAHTVAAMQNGQRPLVLVAEDNTFNQKLAVWLLEKLGYRADVAANGQEAVEAVKRIAYTAVFMDCQMPEMDGFEATTLIRAHEAKGGRRTPIIAMTANAIQGDRERCLAVGMDDYLTKPITPEALSAALGRWVGQEEEATDATTSTVQTAQEVAELVRRVGGDEGLLAQVAELFAVEYPPMVAAVRAAVLRQDAGELRRAAHTLKGMVGNLAAQGAYEAASTLEQLGREGTVAGGEAALGRLEAEVTRFQQVLRATVR